VTLYAGSPRGSGRIELTAPSGADLISLADTETWTSAGRSQTTTASEVERWTHAAQTRDDVVLFEVTEDGNPVGQIFLHDIDRGQRESLVGYHLLANGDRDRGIGTEALALLVDYARADTDLERLIIITAGENHRSRRIAEKNGFAFVGPPKEDPTARCFKLDLDRRTR